MARRNSILVSRTLYQIGVVTLIASIMWTLIAFAQSFTKNPTKISVDKNILDPITIGIDKDTVEQISRRQKIELNFTPQPIPEVTATDSATASSSANINEDTQQ